MNVQVHRAQVRLAMFKLKFKVERSRSRSRSSTCSSSAEFKCDELEHSSLPMAYRGSATSFRDFIAPLIRSKFKKTSPSECSSSSSSSSIGNVQVEVQGQEVKVKAKVFNLFKFS